MLDYMKYGPYICIGVVLAILFVLWAFWGGKNYEFVGLAPLDPNTCGSYTGSVYDWGNITPANNYTPIIGNNPAPIGSVCQQDTHQNPEQNTVVDNTPSVPSQFASTNEPICINDEISPENSEVIAPDTTEIIPEVSKPLILDLPKSGSNTTGIFNLPQPSNPITFSQPARRSGRFVSRGERLCCQTMERIYGVPFTTVRPNWLANPETVAVAGSRANLELDCYNDELKIAVEYNGEQHYRWPNFTNQTYEQFINQVRRDTLKVDLCDRNGVYLIVVPYNVPYDKIPSFIMSYLPEIIQKRISEDIDWKHTINMV